jgi:FkbM family methyltransferase
MLNALKAIGKRLFPKGDETVVVNCDFLPKPMKFYCSSAVENFRTVQMGGEPEFLREFVRVLAKDDIVWDIGSNIGLFGIAAAVTAVAGKVISVDPDPSIVERLRMNIKLNKLSNHSALQYAISDERGELSLFTSGVHGLSPSLRKQSRQGAPTVSVKVPCISGDSLVSERIAPRPSVMKIDVEGAEFNVLNGMHAIFNSASKPRSIFIELHPKFLSEFGKSVADCDELMRANGYEQIFRWDRDAEIQCHFKAIGAN